MLCLLLGQNENMAICTACRGIVCLFLNPNGDLTSPLPLMDILCLFLNPNENLSTFTTNKVDLSNFSTYKGHTLSISISNGNLPITLTHSTYFKTWIDTFQSSLPVWTYSVYFVNLNGYTLFLNPNGDLAIITTYNGHTLSFSKTEWRLANLHYL